MLLSVKTDQTINHVEQGLYVFNIHGELHHIWGAFVTTRAKQWKRLRGGKQWGCWWGAIYKSKGLTRGMTVLNYRGCTRELNWSIEAKGTELIYYRSWSMHRRRVGRSLEGGRWDNYRWVYGNHESEPRGYVHHDDDDDRHLGIYVVGWEGNIMITKLKKDGLQSQVMTVMNRVKQWKRLKRIDDEVVH